MENKENKRKEKVAQAIKDKKIIDNSSFAVFQMVEDLNDRLDNEIPKITEILEKIKGDDGHTPTEEELIPLIQSLIPEPIVPEDGKDYILTDKDKSEIAKSIIVPIVEKEVKTIVEKTEIVREVLDRSLEKRISMVEKSIKTIPEQKEIDLKPIEKRFTELEKEVKDAKDIAISNSVPVTTSFFNGLRAKNLTIANATASQRGDTVTITVTNSNSAIGDLIAGGTTGSVLFINPTNTLAQDNNNFYFQDNATTPSILATNTNVALSINTGGDLTGTDAVNIYGQYDAFLPNSAITNSLAGLNTDGAFPGYSSSSTRGTGAVPIQLNASDMVGGYFGFGTQGASNPTYQNLGGMGIFTTGASANSLGGELRFYIKTDGGSLAQSAIITNAGFLGLGANVTSITATSILTVQQDALGGTAGALATSVVLQNTTVAAAGVQQVSPALIFSGNGWGTTTPASANVSFRLMNVPVQSTTSPLGNFLLQVSVGGGAYVNSLIINSGGSIIGQGTASTTIAYQTNTTLTNSDFAVVTTGLASNTIANLIYGGATTTQYRAFMRGGTSTVLTSLASVASLMIGNMAITTAAAATIHPWISQVVIKAGTITIGTATVTNSATLYIEGAATGATNNYSIYVAAGLTSLQGGLTVVGTTTLDTSLTGILKATTGVVSVATAGTDYLISGTSAYSHGIFTPTTGQTVTTVKNQYNIINPAGALLALTINLPSTPSNNDVVYIKFTQAVTTVTYGNGTVVDGIIGPVAGTLVVLVYDSGTTSWY